MTGTTALIIGGGIAGLSAAAALSPHAQVTVLEGEDALGYHASGRSAAMFLADYGNDTVRALNHASQEHHRDADVLSPRGMMLVGRPQEEDAFKLECTAFGMERLTTEEATALLPILDPDKLGSAGFREGAYDLDTDRLMQHFARSARGQGATILTDAKVTAITRDNGQWQVTTETGTHHATHLVNASGAWADQLARMAGVKQIGLQPYRRSIARLPSPGGHDLRGWPFVDAVGERWYAKPDAGKWLVSPSEEDPHPPHDAWADDMVLAEGLARYEELMHEPVTRVETSWAGLRSFAPDRALVIGPDPAVDGFWWLAGQGGYGFQTAPAAARLLADLFAGQSPDLAPDVVAALSPGRFT